MPCLKGKFPRVLGFQGYSSLRRASALHENLAARLKLLAELHWAQPRPLSEAEARLRNRELPALQAEATQLQLELTVRYQGRDLSSGC